MCHQEAGATLLCLNLDTARLESSLPVDLADKLLLVSAHASHACCMYAICKSGLSCHPRDLALRLGQRLGDKTMLCI